MNKTTSRLHQIFENPSRPLASLGVAVFSSNQLLYKAHFGHRYINSITPTQSLPVDQNTKFRIASISKLVATLGIMQLVEQGKLDIERDVGDYLGFPIRNPHFPDAPITTRMLLSHTSSLRDGGEKYSLPLPYTVREFFEPTGAFYEGGTHWGKSDEPPGLFFDYCNLNYGLLGTLIELTSKQRFDQYMRTHIFEPLALDASYNVRDFSTESIGNVATLYRKFDQHGKHSPNGQWEPQVDDYRGQIPDSVIRVENPGAVSEQFSNSAKAGGHSTLDEYEIGTNGTLFSPQGGLRISVRGLVQIGQLIANNGAIKGVRLLQPETVEQMLTPVWAYDANLANGNTYGGLMRSWGLGTQLITGVSNHQDGDRLLEEIDLRYVGHAGHAYGLLSGLWFNPKNGNGMAFCIGGMGADPDEHRGRYSSFYVCEEEIVTALYEELR